MAKERIFDLPETKGEFKARGLVTGTSKDKYLKVKQGDDKKLRKFLHFGLKIKEDGSSVYCDLQGNEKDFVYFYKKGDKKTGTKGASQKVNFNTRDKFKEEGFEPIGVKVGIEQYIDDKGALKNKNIPMFEFDAVDYLKANLTEEMPVFIRGKMEFSSFINGTTGDKVRMQKFVPTQISGVTTDLKMSDENYAPVNDFIQTIIFMDLQLDETDKDDKKGILTAKVVNYSTIEDVEFIIRDQKIFKTFKKNLKPYNSIKVFGKIHNKVEKEEIEDDGWGSSNNSFEQKNASFIKELLILGADPSTLDKETYTKENVEEALEKIKANRKAREDFGSKNEEESNDWGTNSNDTSSDDEFDNWD